MLDKKKNSLDRYLKDIEGETLLTQNEEQSLAERIRRGDREAVERLITANLRVVILSSCTVFQMDSADSGKRNGYAGSCE